MTQLQEMLRAWEREWDRLGVNCSAVLRAGLDAQQIKETLTDALGAAHDDLVQWFSWHDGTVGAWTAAPTGRLLISLQGALRLREQMLSIVDAEDSDVELPKWDKRWLPLTDNDVGAMFAFDVISGELLEVDWWASDFSSLAADRLATAVAVWVRALSSGYYEWVEDRWQYDFASIPKSLHFRRLLG